jgi:DNA polymerase zeta
MDPLRPERVVRICQRFAVSLNHAICLATRQNPSNPKNGGSTDPRHLHVASVILVKGTPFYGYHIGYSYFLKVSLVNPGKIYVALEQLRKPVVLGREWQPFEAHMNHVLQFMCDFDLYGCGWLELGGGTFREPIPGELSTHIDLSFSIRGRILSPDGDPYASPPLGRITTFDSLTTPISMRYSNSLSPAKDTFAPLEIDVLPHQILNRLRLKPRHLHQDFVELLREPLDPDAKLVPAVAELWEDERRRRAAKGLSLSEDAMLPSGGMGGRSMAELGYKVASGQAGTDQEVKENKGGDWKRSEEMWQMLQERMQDERMKKGKLTFERFSSDLTSGKGGEKRRYDKVSRGCCQAHIELACGPEMA